MTAAKESTVIAERCHNGIKEIKIAKVKINSPTFKYERPTQVRFGDQPLEMDPYERKMMYIGDGIKDDGVFAKKDIKRAELIMYYSGLLRTSDEEELMALYRNTTTVEE